MGAKAELGDPTMSPCGGAHQLQWGEAGMGGGLTPLGRISAAYTLGVVPRVGQPRLPPKHTQGRGWGEPPSVQDSAPLHYTKRGAKLLPSPGVGHLLGTSFSNKRGGLRGQLRQSLTSLKPSLSVTALLPPPCSPALCSWEEEEEEMNSTLAQASVPGDTWVAEAAQIAVVLVLCLTVTFAIFFLGCNLLLQAESLVAAPAQGERRPSHEAEGAAEGA